MESRWIHYRLFSLDEMVSLAMNPPEMIRALIGGDIPREIAERSMMPYWIAAQRMIHAFERDHAIDIGGEG